MTSASRACATIVNSWLRVGIQETPAPDDATTAPVRNDKVNGNPVKTAITRWSPRELSLQLGRAVRQSTVGIVEGFFRDLERFYWHGRSPPPDVPTPLPVQPKDAYLAELMRQVSDDLGPYGAAAAAAVCAAARGLSRNGDPLPVYWSALLARFVVEHSKEVTEASFWRALGRESFWALRIDPSVGRTRRGDLTLRLKIPSAF
jgi:hypothetical protein